jgi:hypothetical protein
MNGHTHDAKTNKIAMREKAKATTLYLTTTSRLIEAADCADKRRFKIG